ncbi:MAG: twin-arginine translocase subunit TatA [Pseudomonadales bacterium]|jgi:sec-independent protein translocase protein TatA|uniref:Sec-independent protein translocase subunit TatA n=1 Tax=Halopseudomonas TaxID=2901189 RepID=UPI000C49ED14|nr:MULTISPECIES: Sec-independent protein translocase subunit TatA [Halopseudomonas]MAS65630.1 twin-arginine translocase subunit TatA [Pseudomonadales bacterium]HBT58242.1 twin-arginine translocase subunit TatA [Pseudomonas sp.]MBP76144.1 twin-arginine translocase subunit TatA [Pseudomonadales bacterium]MCC4260747.1 Sec-independent protein translocase subunit TatA [Halopseudomonas aestusnigri]MCK5529730.1 Sec-independent protein translocase subunit TatA [Halopseudomonas aestusnigri]|tara:strand:- start:15329 stop:15550 length:222 start_codon:yes stop_codon:yes gene_type:complete
MGVGGISIGSLLIVLVIVMLLFGTKRLRNIGSDLGGALSGFRKAVRDTDEARDALTMDVQEQVAERSETRSRA